MDDVDKILFTYYRHKPTEIQKRHFYAYIAITGWFFMHWTMLKESKGQVVGIHKQQWYHFAKNFSAIAFRLYGESIDDGIYEQALRCAVLCDMEEV